MGATARSRGSWLRAALLGLVVVASPLGAANASDTRTEALQAEIKAARYEAARADSDSPEQVRALEKLLELEIRLHGAESPEIIQTIRHIASTVALDDPQRSQKQIPFLLRILKIQTAAGPAQDAAADATRADLVLYHDVSGQFAASIPYLRARVDYLARTHDGRLSEVALDLSEHLLKAGDGAGARAALAALPRDCLDDWAPACARASDHLFDLSLAADDVETLDRLGAGLVRRLRGGACEPRLLRNLSIYFGYKGDDDAGHDLYAGLSAGPTSATRSFSGWSWATATMRPSSPCAARPWRRRKAARRAPMRLGPWASTSGPRGGPRRPRPICRRRSTIT
jgi:hypothetical protein